MQGQVHGERTLWSGKGRAAPHPEQVKVCLMAPPPCFPTWCSPGSTPSARSPSAPPPGGRLGADPPVSTVVTGTWEVPSAEVPALERTASQEETGRKQL